MDIKTNSSLTSALSEYTNINSYSKATIFLVVCFLATSIFSSIKLPPRVAGAKVVGRRVWWEPSVSLQFRFFYDSANIVLEGYRRFKDSGPFVYRRHDADVTIFPMSYLEQIRSFPKNKLSRSHSLLKSVVLRWNGLQFMLRSDLIDRVLTSKVTPNLDKYLTSAIDECNFAWNTIMPQAQEWTMIHFDHCINQAIAATSGRVFVGLPVCRDPAWLYTAVDYAIALAFSAMTLRFFPEWLRGVASYCSPFCWRVMHHHKLTGKLIKDALHAQQVATAAGQEPEDTVLSWMMEKGTEQETEIDEMAARLCMLNALSLHTTSFSLISILSRLCSHPEWLQTFTEEIEDVSQTYGRLGDEDSDLSPTQWISKLEKMDSLIIEVQRLHPIFLTGVMRFALDDVYFKDGTKIPAGTDIAVPSYHHFSDPNVIPNPNAFDPLRNYRKRHANTGEKYDTAGTASPTQLSFGYGGQACPGRYFAVHQMKIILSRLLMEYEFSWPENNAPVTTVFLTEVNTWNPWAKMMIRKKKKPAI